MTLTCGRGSSSGLATTHTVVGDGGATDTFRNESKWGGMRQGGEAIKF
jgi:hypothetical protein